MAARLLNVCFVWILVPERRREKDQRYFSPGWNESSNAPPSVTRHATLSVEPLEMHGNPSEIPWK